MFNAKVATEDELNQLLASNFPTSDRPTLKMSGNRAFICYPAPKASPPGEWRIFFAARQVDGVEHIILFAPQVRFWHDFLTHSYWEGRKDFLDNNHNSPSRPLDTDDLPSPLKEFIKDICRTEK